MRDRQRLHLSGAESIRSSEGFKGRCGRRRLYGGGEEPAALFFISSPVRQSKPNGVYECHTRF
jgi:hypothetical protein